MATNDDLCKQYQSMALDKQAGMAERPGSAHSQGQQGHTPKYAAETENHEVGAPRHPKSANSGKDGVLTPMEEPPQHSLSRRIQLLWFELRAADCHAASHSVEHVLRQLTHHVVTRLAHRETSKKLTAQPLPRATRPLHKSAQDT
jgi:hypothetical protein